ncbi:DUF4166 domain-containing protein [Microbacterium radiodurans]|nr:DUF4166 domain-containing protein [Microbacterium radiodurans]
MFSNATDERVLRRASVYERALGASFDALDPMLRVYFGSIPLGAVGRGEGTFEEAGFTGPTLLRPVIRLFANRRVLFPERERDVPFRIENRVDGSGALRADRVFAFSRRSRRMSDAMTPGPRGTIVDRLGRRGGLEVRLRAHVDAGGMQLDSIGLAARVRGLRIPLPAVARVIVRERVDDRSPGRQRVDVRVSVALLGEVFAYAGSFVYRIEPSGGTPTTGVRTPL